MVRMKITLKAAISFKNSGLGIPILVAKKEMVKKKLKEIGYTEDLNIEIVNSTDSEKRKNILDICSKITERTRATGKGLR